MRGIPPEDLAEAVCSGAPGLLKAEAARTDAQLVLADVLGCALSHAGSSRHPYTAGEHPLWGRRESAACESALFNNALSAHQGDWDSVHYITAGHPGVVLWPLAAAVAEVHRATMQDALAVYLVAHEVMCSLGARFGAALVAGGRHPSTVLAALGGAAAVAWWLEGEPAAVDGAMSLAMASTGGGDRGFGTLIKPFQVASAARLALVAGQFGSRLEAERHTWISSLRDALGASEDDQWPDTGDHVFGERPGASLVASHFKRYPACAYFDQLLEQLEALRTTYPGWRLCGLGVPDYIISADKYASPETAAEAKFSLRYLAAAAWTTGIGQNTFSSAGTSDHRVRAVARDLRVHRVPGELKTLGDVIPGHAILRDDVGGETKVELRFGNATPTATWGFFDSKFAAVLPETTIASLREFCRQLPQRSLDDWFDLHRRIAT
jgi:2-methylcitrate dehydratase PrpD